MLRVGSFLMMILLAAPMVRDCCLPITHALPCHESKPADDEACFSNQQAIAATKDIAAFKIAIDHWFPSAAVIHSEGFPELRDAAREVARAHSRDGIDLYLRTGALLI